MSPTIYLFQKWAYKVEKGWYGFDLEGVPFSWVKKIDEFLDWTEKNIPEFKIHQIKLKFGGIRIYLDLGLPDNLIHDSVLAEYKKRLDALAVELFDENLIY